MSHISHQHISRDITIALLGKQLDRDKCEQLLLREMKAIRYRDAYGISHEEGMAWLFEYGVLVSWGLSEKAHQQLCARVADVVEERIDRPSIEQYDFSLSNEAETVTIQHDLLILPSDNELVTLALSHAFAQSAKLDFFEEKAREVIRANSHISRELATKGRVSLSRRSLAKLRGVLFDTSSDITLHFNLLDTPEFFWDYPELEADYLKLAKYLDLAPRIDIINKKLSTIHDLLEMLAAEQYHKHSSFLEWVIIVLIGVEIVLYFME